MKRLGIIALSIVALIGLYKLSYPTYSCRYRMTVNVEVDGQLRSGSSVIEYSITKQMQFLPGVNPEKHDAEGQAVFVDLGGQRSLIALLKSGRYAEDMNFPVRVVPEHFGLTNDRQLAALPGLRGKWDLAESDLPTLATLSDLSDSATLRIVRPDDLQQIFGRGIRWRGVTIEMTTDPVTCGLQGRLPFMNSQKRILQTANQNPRRFIPDWYAFVR